MKCILCDLEIGNKGFSSHLKRKHNTSNKEYYDKYLKQPEEGICPICGKETKFDTVVTGYRRYCSTKCLNLDPEIRAKIENTSLNRYGVKCNLNLEDTKIKAKENSQSEEAKNKRNKTNLERYGSENVFGSEIIKERIKQTHIKRRGVEYSWQGEDVKSKIQSTNLSKYGTKSHTQSTEWQENNKNKTLESIEKFKLENDCIDRQTVMLLHGYGWRAQINNLNIIPLSYKGRQFIKNSDVQKIIEYNSVNHYKTSYFEQEVFDYISTICENVEQNNRTIIHPYELDIVIPDKKLAIECDGVYWHNTLKKGKDYHIKKTIACQEKGYRLIHIFEYDWYERQAQIKNIIRNALGLSKQIYARNCTFRLVDSSVAKDFLDKNHLQGHITARDYFGLYHNDKLVQLIAIGKSRYKKDEFEILRLCSLEGYHVIGGFEKLLKHQPYKNLISYIDLSKFTGHSYMKAGFEYITQNKPSYHYYKDGLVLNRLSTQKHKLAKLLGNEFDNNKTEFENMTNAGWLQIYDCGNIKVSWSKL